MTGFELQTSGIGSDRSTNWVTTTAIMNKFAPLTGRCFNQWAVVIAWLAERSLWIPVACGLNPVVGKFWNLTYLLLTAEKTKINKKRLVMVHLKSLIHLVMLQKLAETLSDKIRKATPSVWPNWSIFERYGFIFSCKSPSNIWWLFGPFWKMWPNFSKSCPTSSNSIFLLNVGHFPK